MLNKRTLLPLMLTAMVVAAGMVLLQSARAADKDVKDAKDAAVDAKQIQTGIDGGLKWLAAHQITEGPEAGSWDSPRFQTATASFAGLALLANGYRPHEGPYGQVLERAMKYVMSSMDSEGYLGGPGNSMYVHAACTLFGLSYLGRAEKPEKEKELADWCRKSIELVVAAQKERKNPQEQGGWRYTPHSRESDLSVTSWQLLVLHAARQCGYEIDEDVFQSAMKYVNSGYLEVDKQAGFVYRPGVSKAPEPAVTGVALFLKSLLEKETDKKTSVSLEFIREFPPGWGGKQYKGYFFFGTFYMAQGMFQIGPSEWDAFAPKVQRILLDHQDGDGHWPFPPDEAPQSQLAGLGYSTAMGVLILSLDKQYLPMYQRQKRLF